MYLKWHRWNIRSRPFSRTLVLGGVAGELEPIAAEVGYTQEWSSASRLGASRQTNIHTPIYSDGQFGVFNYPKTRVVLGMWEEAGVQGHAYSLTPLREILCTFGYRSLTFFYIFVGLLQMFFFFFANMKQETESSMHWIGCQPVADTLLYNEVQCCLPDMLLKMSLSLTVISEIHLNCFPRIIACRRIVN